MIPSEMALQKTTEAVEEVKAVQKKLELITQDGLWRDPMALARVVGTSIGELSSAGVSLEIFAQGFLESYIEEEGRT